MPTPSEFAEGIRGVVWDADADTPAAGAIVRLTSDGLAFEARTDQSGAFAFEPGGAVDLAPGRYRLVVEFAGRTLERSLTLDAANPVALAGRLDI